MASTKLLEALPPFPNDVPVMNMSKISLAKLSSDNEDEAQRMFTACRELGFFLLDLNDDAMGEEMIKEVDGVIDVVINTMQLSTEEKVIYKQDIPRNFLGYKAEGAMRTETGEPDRYEFFNVGQDDLLGKETKRSNPQTIERKRELLKSYLLHGRQVLSYILQALAKQLSLPAETLEALHDPKKHSGTILRMIRYPPSVKQEDMRTGLLPHTDFGSVTLLANVLGGLQILMPNHEANEESAWRWVKPQPGCLIVNIGDAMVEWTGGVLRSNMHRVNYSPGEQRFIERFSVAMLIRPYKEASMDRIQGGRIPSVADDLELEGTESYTNGSSIGVDGLTAFEWELKKSMALKAGKDCAKSRGGNELRPITV